MDIHVVNESVVCFLLHSSINDVMAEFSKNKSLWAVRPVRQLFQLASAAPLVAW